MVIRFHDPRGKAVKPPEPYNLSIDIEAKPVTLGLIANKFPDAARFMDHVELVLHKAVSGIRTVRYEKPDTSPATPDMRLQIAKECDAVVSAYGH